jgi:hypothetical protein
MNSKIPARAVSAVIKRSYTRTDLESAFKDWSEEWR